MPSPMKVEQHSDFPQLKRKLSLPHGERNCPRSKTHAFGLFLETVLDCCIASPNVALLNAVCTQASTRGLGPNLALIRLFSTGKRGVNGRRSLA
jgi:hypothetical protein